MAIPHAPMAQLKKNTFSHPPRIRLESDHLETTTIQSKEALSTSLLLTQCLSAIVTLLRPSSSAAMEPCIHPI